MRYTATEKHLLSILAGAEELIEQLNPQEKNEKLNKVYRFLHAHNPSHDCYGVHGSWREEFTDFITNGKNIKHIPKITKNMVGKTTATKGSLWIRSDLMPKEKRE